ncbi:hypothetical protein [Pelagicoccus sp. SDUM812005]|uniref:hypothetical protein n=1 Tax=Pelagicoccus sp. SDUM812005 TaxID=3041257 RepID=UPI00280DDF8B|nr:hypothetical protein [Pelagicoccus sp. SDUM812005]MDQ8183351.1 hypothetical protein [Pelagicoccus sp. SDUM812005]
MNRSLLKTISLCCVAFAASVLNAAPSTLATKIVIESVAAKDFPSDAPCFIVYPEGEAFQVLKDSGATANIEKAISKMGYTIVEKDSDAIVYIRVGFTQHEPYSREIEIKQREQIDYSNSASATNYAATLNNGRYTQLANPTSQENATDPSSILGPNGEVIQMNEQKEKGTVITEGERQKLETTIYPMSFQVSAWTFSKDETGVHPHQLWGVLASYNNLRDEEPHPQLLDISKAAARYFGKQLKKEKRVVR